MTGAEVIEEAREYHPAFTIQMTPDPLLMKRVSRYNRELVRQIARINPDELTVWDEISLPMADFDAGEALTAAFRRMTPEIRLTQSQLYGILRVVPYNLKHAPKYSPACTIVADTLRLVGREEEFEQFDQVRVPHIPIPAEITDPTTTLTVPEGARGAMVALVATVLGERTPAPSHGQMWRAPDTAMFSAERVAAEGAFFREVGQRKSVRTVATVSVW